ncbi:hypothetical protein AKJ62_03890 [candidate division MSBL1 archaeon SCGC-AAA259D14]|uniref:Zinc-ribbon domain-containing protein n=1 Tax=candidate division MSBL1 archaeon SCGC-AAA259D14 TaxID=1698261 RepID=A0A133U4G2_9EURY|nr:hypothetical protein AKJ62_03890 [candidate division MSBL1 archaeon SCGC-AAA259D14]
MSEETRYCQNCGEEIDAEADFCPECGSRVLSSVEPKTETEPTSSPWKKVVALAVIIVAVVAGMYMFLPEKGGKEDFHKLGEKVVQNGIQAKVVGVKTVKTVDERKAERGSLYFLVHAKATNIGETRKLLPSVDVTYKGEQLASSYVLAFDEFSSGTRTYQTYDDEEVYPGVGSEGWVVAGLIPKNFDRKDVVVWLTSGYGPKREVTTSLQVTGEFLASFLMLPISIQEWK